MEKVISSVKTNVWSKSAVFAVFLGISILAPFLKQQLITGPIVNAVLFLATAVLGMGAGILIGFLPSMVSALVGLLPAPLLPMIPHIIVSNAILVLTFGILRKRNFFLGIISASFAKFLFLFLIVEFLIGQSLPRPIAAMMAWPQLVTALAGGIIALFLLKITNHYEKKNIS